MEALASPSHVCAVRVGGMEGGGIIGLLGRTVIAICRSKDSCGQLDFFSAKRAGSQMWWGREDVLPNSASS